MNLKTLIPACLVMCLLAGPAFAGHESGEHKGHGEKGEKSEKKGMGLTDDQKAKIKAVKEERKQASQAHKEKIKALHQDLKELLDNEKPDAGAIQKTLASIKTERSNFLKSMEASQAKMETILTPVQLAKMELKHGKGEWKGRGGEHGRDDDEKSERREHRKHHGDEGEDE